jgi:hypothetical protein
MLARLVFANIKAVKDLEMFAGEGTTLAKPR